MQCLINFFVKSHKLSARREHHIRSRKARTPAFFTWMGRKGSGRHSNDSAQRLLWTVSLLRAGLSFRSRIVNEAFHVLTDKYSLRASYHSSILQERLENISLQEILGEMGSFSMIVRVLRVVFGPYITLHRKI